MGFASAIRASVALEERDEQLLAPIIAVESVTEDLPVGEDRSSWLPAALAAKQGEVDSYLDQVRDVVLEVCGVLVRRNSVEGAAEG